MTKAEVALALTPFGQVDAGLSRWQEGAGLGLPIAKALVQLHGGTLEINSATSMGTEVLITLPSRHHVKGTNDGVERRPPVAAPQIPLRMTMSTTAALEPSAQDRDRSIGRIVSVTGAKAIVLLDACGDEGQRLQVSADKPEMGTLFAIDTPHTVVLSIVSALNVPVPAHGEGEGELWIAELGLVGELVKRGNGTVGFNRGVSIYPTLGDRVRVASRVELEQAFYDDKRHSVRVGCIRQDPSIAVAGRRRASCGAPRSTPGTPWTHPSPIACRTCCR
jgi:Histidine kinase-, DNA gyrase B-, and HSP90-like ATPase